MKTRFFSAMLAAFMLATASVGGVTASAAEATGEAVSAADNAAADTTETTVSEPADDSSAVTTATADDMEKFREVMSDLAEAGTTEGTPDYYGDSYYDTDGNATLIKSESIIYNTEEMQFIAVTTKDGHVFYVLLNYSADNGQDNVYFLNRVDDYDLYALLYAGDDNEDSKITPEQAAQAAEKANGRVTGSATDGETAETAENGEATTEPAVQAKSVPMSKNSMMLVFGALALIGVGGAGFFMMKKKNGGKSAVQYQNDETADDEEDDTPINEDDEYRFYEGNNDDDDE